jgi:hypothetical protein
VEERKVLRDLNLVVRCVEVPDADAATLKKAASARLEGHATDPGLAGKARADKVKEEVDMGLAARKKAGADGVMAEDEAENQKVLSFGQCSLNDCMTNACGLPSSSSLCPS